MLNIDFRTDTSFALSIILGTLLLRKGDQNKYGILAQVQFPLKQLLEAKVICNVKIQILNQLNFDLAVFQTNPTANGVFWQDTFGENCLCSTFNMYPERDLLRDGYVLE